MKDWTRIIIVVFVLVGGTSIFGYWSFNQFNYTLDNLTAVYNTATISSFRSLPKPITSPIVPVPEEMDPKFELIFSPKKESVYIGCTYEISWSASTTIKSIETSLIDAGTQKSAGPVASGLPEENTIDPDLQNLKWKVGVVWPGKYFISIPNVNGITIDEKSYKFTVNQMPSNLGTEEQKIICEGTGGSL